MEQDEGIKKKWVMRDKEGESVRVIGRNCGGIIWKLLVWEAKTFWFTSSSLLFCFCVFFFKALVKLFFPFLTIGGTLLYSWCFLTIQFVCLFPFFSSVKRIYLLKLCIVFLSKKWNAFNKEKLLYLMNDLYADWTAL